MYVMYENKVLDLYKHMGNITDNADLYFPINNVRLDSIFMKYSIVQISFASKSSNPHQIRLYVEEFEHVIDWYKQ